MIDKIIYFFVAIGLTVVAEGALVVIAQNLPLDTLNPRYGAVVGADQEPDGEPYQRIAGQTFLAQSSGQLHAIEATVDMSAGYTPVHSLMVSLVSLTGGQPGDILDSTMVPPSEIPLGYFGSEFTITALFDGGISLEAGNQYAIEFTSFEGPAHFVLFGASTIVDYYSDGVAYSPQPSGDSIDPTHRGDFFFRVTGSVPEPSTAILAVVGSLSLLRRRVVSCPPGSSDF